MHLKPNSPHAVEAGPTLIGFNLVNGKEVEGDLALILSKSPVDSRDLVGMFPDSGDKDVARAAKAAAEAFQSWSRTPAAERAGVLLRGGAARHVDADEPEEPELRRAGLVTGLAEGTDTRVIDGERRFHVGQHLARNK